MGPMRLLLLSKLLRKLINDFFIISQEVIAIYKAFSKKKGKAFIISIQLSIYRFHSIYLLLSIYLSIYRFYSINILLCSYLSINRFSYLATECDRNTPHTLNCHLHGVSEHEQVIMVARSS